MYLSYFGFPIFIFLYMFSACVPRLFFILTYTHDFIYTPLPTRLAVYPHSQAKGRPVSLAGSSQSRLGCSPTDAFTCRLRIPRICACEMPSPDPAQESSLYIPHFPCRHQTRGCRANDDLTHSPTPVHPPVKAPPETRRSSRSTGLFRARVGSSATDSQRHTPPAGTP